MLGSKQLLEKGKEVVVQFAVIGMENEKEFFTDSNNMEMQFRKLDYRPSWDLHEEH